MKIVSNFHDYYDSVMSMGIDKECVYIRKEQEILMIKEAINEWHQNISGVRNKKHEIGTLSDIHNSNTSTEKFYIEDEYILIGFCGKLYPCVRQTIIDRNTTSNVKPMVKCFYRKSKEVDEDLWWKDTSHFNKNWDNFKLYFIEYKVPIFVIKTNVSKRERVIILNSNLKQYQFYTIKDTYTAYQEIYQYISGVLGVNQKEIIEVSNKDKVIKHGYDKWSFKTRPKEKDNG